MQYQTLHAIPSKYKLSNRWLCAALLVFVLMSGFLTGCGRLTPEQQGVFDKYANYPDVDWYNENKAELSVVDVSNEEINHPEWRIPEEKIRAAMRAEGLTEVRVTYSNEFRPDVKLAHIEGGHSLGDPMAITYKRLLRIKFYNDQLPLQKKMAQELLGNDQYADSFGKKFYVLNAETLENIPVIVARWATKAVFPGGEIAASTFNGFVIAFDFNNPEVKKARFILVCFAGISKDESQELETAPLFFMGELSKDYYTPLVAYPKRLGDPLKKKTPVATLASTAAPAPVPTTAGAGKGKVSRGKTETPKAQEVESRKLASNNGDTLRTNSGDKSNGTLEIVTLYLPDFIVCKPAVGQKMKNVEVYLVGDNSWDKSYKASKIVTDPVIYDGAGTWWTTDKSEIRAIFDIPRNDVLFKPKKIKFVVDGKEMYYDLSASKWE